MSLGYPGLLRLCLFTYLSNLVELSRLSSHTRQSRRQATLLGHHNNVDDDGFLRHSSPRTRSSLVDVLSVSRHLLNLHFPDDSTNSHALVESFWAAETPIYLWTTGVRATIRSCTTLPYGNNNNNECARVAPPDGALANYEALAIFIPTFSKNHGLRRSLRVLARTRGPGHARKA